MSTPQTPHNDDLLLVGTVVNTVGLRGDVRMHIVSTQIEHLATTKPMLYTADGSRSFRLRRIVHYKNDLYTVDLGGIATRDLAEAIRGLELYITRADAAPRAPPLARCGRFSALVQATLWSSPVRVNPMC